MMGFQLFYIAPNLASEFGAGGSMMGFQVFYIVPNLALKFVATQGGGSVCNDDDDGNDKEDGTMTQISRFGSRWLHSSARKIPELPDFGSNYFFFFFFRIC